MAQNQNEEERVIVYFSKIMTPPEKNDCVARRELPAVIQAVKHFTPHHYRRHFHIKYWSCLTAIAMSKKGTLKASDPMVRDTGGV